jgi:hypothetical protein
MPTVDLQSSPFYGNTSRPVGRLEYTRTGCLKCGSPLHGRSEGVRKWGDKVVRTWLCPCGRRRRVEVTR